MTEIVLRHPDLPNQPIIGTLLPDGSVLPNMADAGWQIDADTPPERAKQERPEPREQQETPAPHFAEAPATPEPPAVAPEPTEQGETSLELPEGE